MIFLDFDLHTPLYVGTPFGGGVKASLRIVAAVCVFGLGCYRIFFLYMDPLTHGGGPRSQLQVPPVAPPPPPHMAPWQ